MQMLAWLQQQMLNLEHQVDCFLRTPSCHICPCSNRSLILRSPACGWSEAVRIWCSGAKLQERTSGQFNLDIAKFAKIAEESKSQAGQVPEPAQKVPSPREQAAKPVRRDWNAQVHPTLDVQHFCTCCR